LVSLADQAMVADQIVGGKLEPLSVAGLVTATAGGQGQSGSEICAARLNAVVARSSGDAAGRVVRCFIPPAGNGTVSVHHVARDMNL
jgi:hypothetical protein